MGLHVSLSRYCCVGLSVSELLFWLKPGAQFSLVGQSDAKKGQTGRLKEAELEGLNPRIACGKACETQKTVL